MTKEEAKEILKTKPVTQKEIILFKQALIIVSTEWSLPPELE